jgi:hypothetical protein
VLFTVGSALFIALVGLHPSYLAAFLPGMLIGGAGVGLALPSFTIAATRTLKPQLLATGIGAQTMFRQIGGALGVAALVAILWHAQRHRWTHPLRQHTLVHGRQLARSRARPDTDPQAIRHTGAASRGEPDPSAGPGRHRASERLGHESPAFTLNQYAHVIPGM